MYFLEWVSLGIVCGFGYVHEAWHIIRGILLGHIVDSPATITALV